MEGPASFSLPEAAHASKVSLNRPLREACELYNSMVGVKRKVALSTFERLRPKKNVKLQKQIPLNSCLCEVCENFKLKSKALIVAGVKNVVSRVQDAVSMTFCAHKHLAEHPDPSVRLIGRHGYCKCIFRKCQKCGVKKMKRHLQLANSKLLCENKNVHWHSWEHVKRALKKGNKISKVTRVE